MNKLPTLAPQTMAEAMDFSKMISHSQMVPKQYQGKPQDVLVAIQWGYELGLQPLQALQNIAVINGKPSVYGDAALALVKNDPRCAGVSETVTGDGDAKTATCLVKRRYGDDIEETVRTFSVRDAKMARLWGKPGPWQQYPDRMLMMRARGFALRDAFPDALKGVITAEEAQDMPSEPKDITPKANPLDRVAAARVERSEPPAPTPEPDVEDAVYVEQVDEDLPSFDELPPEPAPQPEPEPEPEPEPQAAAQPVGLQLFNHQGKPIGGQLETAKQYTDGFIKLMRKYVELDKSSDGTIFTSRQKMTLLRELREANQERIDKLSDTASKEVLGLYKLHLRQLGAGGKDAS
jgi:hypothetical protein